MKRHKETLIAVFLDRDGTINLDTGYMSDPEALELLPGAGSAIKELNEHNVLVVVVSNQSAVARGYATEEQVESVNRRLKQLLKAEGAYCDDIFFCPHHPEDSCGCRKPDIGLIEAAKRKLSIIPEQSYMVGDKRSDMELARRVGATAIMVLTGLGEVELNRSETNPDFTAKDLGAAVKWILDDLKRAKKKSDKEQKGNRV